MWVYLNERFVKDDQARISVFDRGFLYGDGIFETLRIHHARPLFLDRHLHRLRRSCESIGLRLPIPEPHWEALLRELVERNRLERTMIRITISRGVGDMGLEPSEGPEPTIVLFPRPLPRLTEDQREHGVRIAILHTRRQPSCALPSHVKSLNYLNNVLAKQEAIEAHTFDGLLLNTDGYLAECTTSNIFFVKNQRLHTPSLQCGILPGITREIVLELAREERIDIQEGTYRPEALIEANECFLTNSGFGILPVSMIDAQLFTSSKAGSVTKTIQHMYEKHVADSL